MSAVGEPTTEEVRAALGRIISSEGFRHSPQMSAFLRFVVEAKLRGEAEQIKAYTIATEALGRRQDFDPQDDPIVRTRPAGFAGHWSDTTPKRVR